MYYKKIYFDTGIVDEHQILSNYLERTDSLFDEILDKIEHCIKKWYFWIIIETSENYELSKLIIKVRSYNITTIVKKENKNIYIENIFFN